MKIEQDKLSLPTAGADTTSRSTGIAGGSNAAGRTSDQTTTKGDALTLSPELQFLHGAANAAAEAPAVRSEVVARMRALLESGGVGQDAAALADALIDAAIDRK
jgi:flagellar biosynthesis anti-sigma factor FlgM